MNIKRDQKIIQLKQEVQKFKEKYGNRFAWAISLKRNKYIVDALDEIFPQLKDGDYTIQTKLYWLLYDMNDFPKCVVCGKPIHKNVGTSWIYATHCSRYCAAIDKATLDKTHQTNMKLYGVPCTLQTEKSWNAIHQAVINKYGGTTGNIWETEYGINKCKETKLKKNNGKYESEETKQKRKNKIISKYGGTTGNIFGTEYGINKIKQTNLQRIGYEYYTQTPKARTHMSEIQRSPEMRQKINETKRRNGTFNTSKPEEDSYVLLCNEFSKENVIRQYRSEKYPFNCDFYIKSLDLYIECNFSWTHGKHWFDENNEEDLKILNKWKEKGTKYYLNAIYTWTKLDVKKRKIAEENNLNYIIFWKFNEIKQWLESLKL